MGELTMAVPCMTTDHKCRHCYYYSFIIIITLLSQTTNITNQPVNRRQTTRRITAVIFII